MGAITQTVSWWCFVPNLMTAEQFVRTAAEAGFTALDLVPPEHWELVTDHGIAISSTQAHLPLEIGMNQLDQHDRLEREIRAKLAQAERWRIPNLVCFSGNRNGLDDAAGAEHTVAGFARVAPAAEDAGVTLVLELLNSRVDHPDYQADRTAWGVEVCRAVGSPRVKLLYDIYHLQIMEGNIIRTIQAAHPFIGHYHTAGVPGRRDLDDEQELNYPAILRAIRDTGYTGYVGHEFIPKADPVAALHTTFARCAPYL
ncbi:MAG TPA: TIM barrel protein [Herpetosiphonaceae bacterium]